MSNSHAAPMSPQPPALETMTEHALAVLTVKQLAHLCQLIVLQNKHLEALAVALEASSTQTIAALDGMTDILEDAFPPGDDDEESLDEPVPYVPAQVSPRRGAPPGPQYAPAPVRTIERVLDEPAHRSPYEPIDDPSPEPASQLEDDDERNPPANRLFRSMCVPRDQIE